jgi:hypothetical protein
MYTTSNSWKFREMMEAISDTVHVNDYVRYIQDFWTIIVRN